MNGIMEAKPKFFFALKWKLIAYFGVFMLLTIFVGIYINLGLKMSGRFFKGLLDEYKYLEVLDQKVEKLKSCTENYLADDSYSNLEKCWAANAELSDRIEDISDYLYITGNPTKYYSYQDLIKCLEKFLKLSEKTVKSRRDKTLEIAYSYNYQMAMVADVISKYLTSMINHNITWGNERFERLTQQTKKIEYLSYSLAFVIALLGIVFCVNFSLGITQPLNQMVTNAKEIGEGNFQVNEVLAESDDEMRVIAKVFNGMSRNISTLFEEIRQKAMLERALETEKRHTLEMENQVRSAELQVLQSQVNPHFLYNTLNAISQVAILEDATETGDLIKAVARLLRYNLGSLEQPVTVDEELAHIREYIYIMGVRYGERIKCQISSGANVNSYLIPCMTLQPILENAYIHGVAPLIERAGTIEIRIWQKERCLQIEIADDGVGIPEAKLIEMLAPHKTGEAMERRRVDQSSGLGLININKRLELFFKHKDLMKIISLPGEGTRILLTLPMVKEANPNV